MIRSESRSILRSVARVRNSCITTRVLPAMRAMRCRSSWANSSFASRSLIAWSRAFRASQSALRSAIARSSCFASSLSVARRSVGRAEALEKLADPLVLRRDRQRALDVFGLTLELRPSLEQGLGFAPQLGQPLAAQMVEQRPGARRERQPGRGLLGGRRRAIADHRRDVS